jgi:hypothetical protein
MINENDIELIENYLSGKLTEQENIAIKNRIKNDTNFAGEVEFIRDLKISSKELGRNELRNKLQKIAADNNSGENKNNLRTHFAIAASALVLIGLASILYFMQSKSGINENKIADLSKDTVSSKEINQLISKSVNDTKLVAINQLNDGLGFAGKDSSINNKLPLVIINSSKYNNNYIYRDTLFLFLELQQNLSFFSIGDEPNNLYFSSADKLFYSIKLLRDDKMYPLENVRDKKIIDKLSSLDAD